MRSRLLRPVAIPGWVAVLSVVIQHLWTLSDWLSRIDFIAGMKGSKILNMLWSFVLSPLGNTVLIVVGLAWIWMAQKMSGTAPPTPTVSERSDERVEQTYRGHTFVWTISMVSVSDD